MEKLERIWEIVSGFFSSLLRVVERTITGFFGSSNARMIKRMHAKIEAINALEERCQEMSNEELKDQTRVFKERLAAGEMLDDILNEAFAVCREGGVRFLGMRHYDVQLIGGMVLHSGAIAEMVTGEGKTLVATLPAYLNALEGKGVHVVTVNDYLARRDMEWMAPLYMGLGLTVGAIQSDMQGTEGTLRRQEAYACDITYGTNNEFGFDYLRDNMRSASRGDNRYDKRHQQSQGPLNYAIVDEVDNILIDEARTPLIISGPAEKDIRKYSEANRIAMKLKKDEHFKVNEKDHTASLTDEGVRAAEKAAGVESFYTAGNMEWPHLIDNALKAHHLYKKDVNYVVKEGRVIIVDEFTGRLMDGRQWSDGLHQSVEAKESVKIKEETQTMATITLQNYFKLYNKLCGMTGTAMTEANEFWKIYKLDVVAIPTNRPMRRDEMTDVIYKSEKEKYEAVADDIERVNKFDVVTLGRDEILGTIVKEDDNTVTIQPSGSKKKQTIPLEEIKEVHHKGRPVLVGTVSIEKSERLAKLLDQRGIKHEVLNAKNHKREAEIVAQAGRRGAVTIATNMAGRGTDIVLGGNAETMTWARLQDTYETRLDVPQEEWDELVHEIETLENMKEEGELVKELGGLHVIGTERHEARRIDLQLRGRTGRQGDPGSSRFFLSLEDDLMRIFFGEWVQNFLTRMGLADGEAIESRMISRRIEGAQKKREEHSFEIRKNLLEYDEVMDEQRKRVYGYRQAILDGTNCRDLIIDMIREQVDYHVDMFTERDFGPDSFAAYAGKTLTVQLEGRHFRGLDIRNAESFAKEEAERLAETDIIGAIDENLPDASDEEAGDIASEWNWEALAKFGNARWDLNLRDRDLKKAGRDQCAELLIEKARDAIQKVDLTEGKPYLDEQYGLRTTIGWVRAKFGLEINIEELAALEVDAIKDLIVERAEQNYDERESEYPVIAGLYKFTSGTGGSRIDREGLVNWAKQRFESELSLDDLKNKQRDEIRDVLIQHSRDHSKQAATTLQKVEEKVESLFGDNHHQTAGKAAGGNGALSSLSDWLKETLRFELSTDEIAKLEADELQRKLVNAVEDHYHPEMRRMERMLLLDLVDSAWKDHLYSMDYLRSSVGLKGYAQMDPKVEYKREGMKMFEGMWTSIGERTTDLVFHIQQLDEGVVGSTWVDTTATHEQAQSTSEYADQQEAAIRNSGNEGKVDTIRNKGQKVGRNDPCPCRSGKKYKKCCGRLQGR